MEGLPKIELARWRGVPIFVDVTFVLVPLALFPWRLVTQLATTDWSEIHVRRPLALWILVVAGTFGSILLHELAHAFAARRFRAQTAAIQIGAFYGLAIMPVTAALRRALVPILAAGPLANVAIAVVIWIVMGMPEVSGRLGVTLPRSAADGVRFHVPSIWDSALVWLFQLNVAIAIYNVLPAFPLDGGRMARIGLRRWIGEARAVSLISICGFVVGIWSILGGIGLSATLLTAGFLLIIYNFAIWRREIEAPPD